MRFKPFFKVFRGTPESHRRWIMLKKTLIACVFMGCLYGLATTHIRFVITATPSLPHRLFMVLKRHASSRQIPGHDWYVFFEHPAVQTKVMKQVKGVSGQTLWYDDRENLWVDDFCVGKPHPTAQDGTLMQAIKSGVIPEGYVFVFAPHERSFDSRYQAFGLIPIHSIQGVGVAIL